MLKVYLSPLAEKKLSLLLEYIEHKWTTKERDEFLKRILNSIGRVATHPESSPKSHTLPNIYKCVVSKHTSFFYRFNSEDLEIITVFDNRQDPYQIESEIIKHVKQK